MSHVPQEDKKVSKSQQSLPTRPGEGVFCSTCCSTPAPSSGTDIRTPPGSTSVAAPGHGRRHRQSGMQLPRRRGHRRSCAPLQLLPELPVLLPERAAHTEGTAVCQPCAEEQRSENERKRQKPRGSRPHGSARSARGRPPTQPAPRTEPPPHSPSRRVSARGVSGHTFLLCFLTHSPSQPIARFVCMYHKKK